MRDHHFGVLHRRSHLGVVALALAMVMAGFAGLGIDVALPASATTWTVTNCNDSGPGSLRQAVADASSATSATITFAMSAACSTIMLTSGDIEIAQNLTIQGPGAAELAVSGDNDSDVFQVDSGVTAAISGLTIEDGSTATSGGGIVNNGTLTLTNSIVSDNNAEQSITGSGGGIVNNGTLTLADSIVSDNNAQQYGGGIANTGTLNVNDSTVTSNDGSAGGGISTEGGDVTITDSTVSGNYVGCCGEGGGLNNYDGTMTVIDSTVSDNTAIFYGGGVLNYGTFTISNSTVSDNYVGGFPPPNCGDGGGIANYGTISVTNSTVAGNVAGEACPGEGGGIYAASGTANLEATILAENDGDCYGVVSDDGYNIDDDGTCGFVSPSISDSATLNATLGPLGNNGGPTETVALLPGSPAIGQVPGTDCPATDQRGDPRGDPCDIGAFDTDTSGLMSQTITFTSTPPSPAIVRGPTYTVTATGGGSGNPVTFSTAPLSTTSTCSVSGSTVSFIAAGICTIDANQAGDSDYSAATTATQSFSVTNGPDAITSSNTATATVGSSFSFMVNTTGAPIPTIKFMGSLPTGLTFVDNGDGTATISGTPAALTSGAYPHRTGGVYNRTITATFGTGRTKQVISQSFTLYVDQAPTITSGASKTVHVGVPFTFTVKTKGYPPPSITQVTGVPTATSPLPSGVRLTDNGNGTATLAGTPASGTAGTYLITIQASNDIGSPADQSFSLVVKS